MEVLAYDEIWYGKIAVSIIEGRVYTFSPLCFSVRWTFLPLTAIYSIFGINDFSNFFNVLSIGSHWLHCFTVLKKYVCMDKICSCIILFMYAHHHIVFEKPMPMLWWWQVLPWWFMDIIWVISKYTQSRITHIICSSLELFWSFFSQRTFSHFYPIFIVLLAKRCNQRKKQIFWFWTVTNNSYLRYPICACKLLLFWRPIDKGLKQFLRLPMYMIALMMYKPMSVLLKRITTLTFGWVYKKCHSSTCKYFALALA